MADGGGPADVISQFETNSNHSASFSALLVSLDCSFNWFSPAKVSNCSANFAQHLEVALSIVYPRPRAGAQ
jgi:hypothetical protein